ncbi:hypothetical protein A1O1_04951 [Capronia coronata CBS 617.96]|uniref:Peptidase S8/S53 domain-containing protein n=1 Tax=Capronia coronata CBS 617.96 TaxID=1182541 RepID=W9Z0H1_9EURO|nr:uncharacterized protein A1O1_04951 [Capronia coronata CBS 617.96]EXJ88024.1 hypothetical protein A1O1_04951 [Capronia coronata CBS 617.96]
MEKQPTARNAAPRSAKESATANTSYLKNPAPTHPPARVDSGPGIGPNTSKQRGPLTARNNNEPEKEGFDPAEIMETMISQWKSPTERFKSKAQYITELMTAINSDGESLYQVRERKAGKDPRSKDRKLLERLRTIIMTEIKDIAKIGKALYGSQEYELCLDMSDFNRSSHDFTRFIKKLRDAPESDFKFRETGTREFFAWLKNEKKVNIINDLKIPDSATHPPSEELIKEAIIDQFEIEKFDWRKLDVSLDMLTAPRGELGGSGNNITALDSECDPQPQFRDKIKEITLYSSGNWSVLYHWASEEGLKNLGEEEGLRSVKINIVELEPSSDKRSKEVHEKRANHLKEKLAQKFIETGVKFNYKIIANAKWDFPVLQISDDEQTVIPQLQLFQNLAECQRYLFSLKDEIKHKDEKDWSAYARRFHDRPVRIAVLDNGADKIRSTLKQHIEKGVSFVTANSDGDNRILPWWMVADPHGTQMASLITSANPFCRLYIARVGTGRKDILPERAAQAVKWAIEQKVDVLSLSWTTRTNHPELEKAIKLAAGDHAESPILIFSSTADEGVDPGKIFPAAYMETFSVAATDRYGHVRPASQEGVDILVPGEDISADGPVYMQKFTRGTVTGSSVATALAAGIASLSLLMLRVFNEDQAAVKEFTRKAQMMAVFQKMQKIGSGHHGIQVSQLFEGRDPKTLEKKWRASAETFPRPPPKPILVPQVSSQIVV